MKDKKIIKDKKNGLKKKILSKIQPIFRKVFENKKLVLNEKLNASKVKNWNSLNHITLIVELESFCKVSFTTEELVKLNNVGDFVNLLIKKKYSV
jgi:acyl carrier protein